MNAIQQISLKLQMGLDPSCNIDPHMLRAMWRELSLERQSSQPIHGDGDSIPHRASHPSLNRAV